MMRNIFIIIFLLKSFTSFGQVDTLLFSGYESSGFHQLSKEEILKRYGTDDESEQIINEFFNSRSEAITGRLLSGTAALGFAVLASGTYDALQKDNAMGGILTGPLFLVFSLASISSGLYLIFGFPPYKSRKWLYGTLKANHLKQERQNSTDG